MASLMSLTGLVRLRRKGRWRLASSALVLSVLGSSPTARAEDSTPPATAGTAATTVTRTVAQDRFKRGLELARQQLWDAALAEFVASRAAFPTRSATRNAAVALVHLRRFAEACEQYRDLLRLFGEEMPRAQRESAQAELAAILVQTGEIAIESQQSGAIVFVDGTQRGTTPLNGAVRVDPGTHRVRLEKAGFATTEIVVTVASAVKLPLDLRLRPLVDFGTLVVRETTGKNLPVLLDHDRVGTTPFQRSVPRGVHLVQLGHAGIQGTGPSSVVVRGAAETTLVLKAELLDAHLQVEPVPSNAQVYIDGVAVGGGVWEGALPSGLHRIEVSAPHHFSLLRTTTLRPGQSSRLSLTLDPDAPSPRASRPAEIHAQLSVGGLWSAALNGSDDYCSCKSRQRPLGAIARASVGYALGRGLSVELAAGYLSIWQRMTRAIESKDSRPWRSNDFNDQTRLAGPWGLIGLAFRSGGKAFFVSRIAAGFAVLRSRTLNGGHFVRSAATTGSEVEVAVAIDEQQYWLPAPLAVVGLGAGYQLSRHLSLVGDLALMHVMPSLRQRSPTDATFSQGTERAAGLGSRGRLTLPDENVARDFLTFAPSVGLEYRF